MTRCIDRSFPTDTRAKPARPDGGTASGASGRLRGRMPPESPREFFETLESRVDPAKAGGLTATYRFEIDGAGTWTVDVDDGRVSVSENGAEADTTITTSSETFMKIARGEQNPTAAYMSGKLKVKGDMGRAMKLQKLF
jgi:alkyl sulfatase BDS1-like metallo-beta-lactamase superfamily hydrolase